MLQDNTPIKSAIIGLSTDFTFGLRTNATRPKPLHSRVKRAVNTEKGDNLVATFAYEYWCALLDKT